ncbi:MAG TPA: hypothetical protein VF520_01015 [Thermoleophilaceae bacterium]|jgi:hypothetical protein
MSKRAHTILLAAFLAALCLLPGTAVAQSTGGAQYQPPPEKATIVNGRAVAPANAPDAVRRIIAAGNRIVEKPYRYGGGHAKFADTGYDCSGTVSYALRGARLLDRPLDSSDFMSWGQPGKGLWVTVYTNPGHAYMIVAGLRLDTGFRDAYGRKHGAKPGSGPRWGRPRPTDGYTARHPLDL